MKNIMLVASLILGVFGLTVPIHAAQKRADREIKQWTPKKAKIIADHASMPYKGSPQFVPITGTSISYATNTPYEVINIDEDFYIYRQGFWLVSANPHGPWTVADYVPEVVSIIVCSELNFNVFDPYQHCSLPLASRFADAVWANWASPPEVAANRDSQ